MPKHGKKYLEARGKVEGSTYALEDAVGLAKDASFAKFDETLEVSMRLGVDPRHADQMVRGTVVLPHGTGRSKKVLVFASGEKMKEAEENVTKYFRGTRGEPANRGAVGGSTAAFGAARPGSSPGRVAILNPQHRLALARRGELRKHKGGHSPCGCPSKVCW